MKAFERIQRERADADSRFIDCNGFRVHFKLSGRGETLIVLLHGSFLSIRSWREVAGPLAENATVLMFDRPAFGLTSRPLPGREGVPRYSPEAQSDLIVELMHRLGFEKGVLVGNSTGGTLALLCALRHPESVRAIVLAGAMVYSGYATSEVPRAVLPVLRAMSPFFSRVMRSLITRLYDRNIRGFWRDPSRLDDSTLAAFRGDLMVGDWSRAFWELFLETHHLHLDRSMSGVSVPSLVITGEQDLTVKTGESLRLARELPGAELSVIPDCAHLPQEEAPEAFVDALRAFLKKNSMPC